MIAYGSNLLRSLIDEHVRRAVLEGKLSGLVLNLSAGSIDYRDLIEAQRGTHMVSTDWLRAPTAVKVNVYCDARILPFASQAFDAALCTEVLEHLPNPSHALGELARVLKRGAWLLVTTPFVYQAHQRPYDFYRYTDGGLRHLLRSAGFIDVELRRSGDSLAVLLHALKMQRWRGTSRILKAADRLYLQLRGERAISADVSSDSLALGYCATGRTAPTAPGEQPDTGNQPL